MKKTLHQQYHEFTNQMDLIPLDNNTQLFNLMRYAGCMSEENGELWGKIKRVIRDDNGVITEDRRDQMIKELGDILFYYFRMLEALGTDFEEVVIENMEKLIARKAAGTIKGEGDGR